jgi:hypothetical protein
LSHSYAYFSSGEYLHTPNPKIADCSDLKAGRGSPGLHLTARPLVVAPAAPYAIKTLTGKEAGDEQQLHPIFGLEGF